MRARDPQQNTTAVSSGGSKARKPRCKHCPVSSQLCDPGPNAQPLSVCTLLCKILAYLSPRVAKNMKRISTGEGIKRYLATNNLFLNAIIFGSKFNIPNSISKSNNLKVRLLSPCQNQKHSCGENMPITAKWKCEFICMELCMQSTSSSLLTEQHDYTYFGRYNFLIDSFWDIYKIQMYKSVYKYNPSSRNIIEILNYF